MQRNCCANCVAQLARPHSGAVHHCIGPDHFAVGNYANCSAAFNNNSFNLDVLKNFDTVRARTLCKRLRHVDWVDNTISWQVHRTNQVVHSGKWHQIFYVGRSNDVDGQTKHSRHRCTALQFFEAFLVWRNRNRTTLLKASGLTSFLFQRGKQVCGVLREAREVLCCSQLPNQTGSVPCGSARELLALQQHHV